jgi:hypothetical protein
MAGALGFLAAIPSRADEPPALTPPVNVPAPAPPAQENAPPGIAPNVPARRIAPGRPKPLIPSLQPIESEDAPPALTGPAEMGSAPAPDLSGARSREERAPASSESPSLLLESAPLDDSAPVPMPRPRSRPPTSRNPSRDRDVTEPPPSPRRRGLFGLFQLPPGPGRRSTSTSEAIEVEPRSDPAADAALKRRIEREARNAVGDKLRSLDVSVVDRNVTIRARVTRFWYRRGVRRNLEALPGLTGYKTRVDVVE